MKHIRLLTLFSLLLLIVSWSQKDRLPSKDAILPQLLNAPYQSEISLEPFTIKRKGYEYVIRPRTLYSLSGMVVSYHNSRNWFDYYHSAASDFLNAKDICLVWGKNVENVIWRSMKFSSGPFCCYYQPKAGVESFEKFCKECLSNNHILAADDDIFRSIMSMEKGDQVYLEGYLVDYRLADRQEWRTTSLIRQDRGCEIIFVKSCRILVKANPLWRMFFSFSVMAFIACSVLSIVKFFQDPIFPKYRIDT